jgi:hypothetical protein
MDTSQQMLGRVSLPFRFDFDRPFKFSSDVGENWNLHVHKLRDGIVILGVRAEITPENLQGLFLTNASRFGASVADGLDTPERAIHESFDWVIIDSDRTLRWAIGEIPLKSAAPAIPDRRALMPVRQIGKAFYSAFVQPVKTDLAEKSA